MSLWIGIDVGGTFTDFIACDDDSGAVVTHKSSSTPGNPAAAIVAGLRDMFRSYGLDAREVAQIAHGTTVATNALIERKGAKVALITTKGFRDVLEIGRQRRPDHLDMHRDYPPAVVPRWRRFEVNERVLADRSVMTPLTDQEIERVVDQALASGADAVAVALVFSYIAPEHEQRIGAALTARQSLLPTPLQWPCYVSLSSEVHPEFREYERTSTTTLNAYLQPTMSRYLSHLSSVLAREIPQADVVISQSTGGLMSLDKARRFPIRTALSGPAAGVLGAVDVARQADFTNIITFDMGGTSADVSMVRNLEPAQSHDKLLGGLPLRLPSVDISTVGAGGGSITWFSRDGALKVGPASAGADPGPACYGLGGSDATVTDANLVLGRLAPAGLLGGTMKLDEVAARQAIAPIAERLGFSVEAAAHGILEIAVSNMSRVIRAVSIERGHDPRELSLLAYGGAGPLHARAVAASLQMRAVIVPTAPGILCAAGLIASNLKEDFIRTARVRLHDAAAIGELERVFDDLHRAAQQWFDDERILAGSRYLRVALDLRFVGQNFELELPLIGDTPAQLPPLPTVDVLLTRFFEAHERTYGFYNPEAPVEVLSARLTAGGDRHHAQQPAALPVGVDEGHAIGQRAICFERDESAPTAVYRREDLIFGQRLEGPAVIEQLDTTTLLFPHDSLMVDRDLNLIITVAT
ncbi:MAG: N-methylhydantoinase A [Gammaproteobacteria bacterium]|jgi:N-methylhydantoinase A